jgi:hypothetical protein
MELTVCRPVCRGIPESHALGEARVFLAEMGSSLPAKADYNRRYKVAGLAVVLQGVEWP